MASSNARRRHPRFIDLTGRTFSYWQVLSEYGMTKHGIAWNCRCQCGAVCKVLGTHLRGGGRTNCGCLKSELARLAKTKHGHTKHGGPRSPEYITWRAMLDRCLNEKCPSYSDYGGRGIRIHPEWIDSFTAFLGDVGTRPTPKHSLDRYPDNSGNYEPGNVRWATKKQQANNRRNTIMLTSGGRTQSIREWADEVGVLYSVLASRIRRGWGADRAISAGSSNCRKVFSHV